MFKSLLIATDGSELGDKAVDAGLDLARTYGASVTIITATDPVATGIGSGGFGTMDAGPIIARLEETYRAEADKLLAAAKAKADAAGIAAKTVHAARSRPADAILEAAKAENADTIIMGSHGRRGLKRLLLGSQASEVLSHAGVPVLIVK
ncbi:MAG: universal stress protein [Devosia sp.]|jgi:nucleotide-binding universal stress UspA family protein|uniref:universal stress protein n=1 Tax=unclassified Devosia TaxID=196773 RepID=UPI001A032DD6|nr:MULTISPECIES: universal stress protein [unclassified Devosia]MBF0680278.1 universal stress protein [Devosia sp.]WEJ33473.1 universal stress protein [Devosia sp. SD17-2]